jgi:hypothetical protein
LRPQFRLPCHDPDDLGIQRRDIHRLPRFLLLDVGRNRDVLPVLRNLTIRHQPREMLDSCGV